MKVGAPLPLVGRFPVQVLSLIAEYGGSRCGWCCEGTAVLVKAEGGPYDWVCITCAVALLPDETPYRMHLAAGSSVTCDAPYVHRWAHELIRRREQRISQIAMAA